MAIGKIYSKNFIKEKNTDPSYYINIPNIWDKNYNTEGYTTGSEAHVALFKDFDMSEISKDIKKINSIKIKIIYQCFSNKYYSFRCVHDTTTAESVQNDCGDGFIKFKIFSNRNEAEATFPKATEYWDNHLEEFLQGKFQLRGMLYRGVYFKEIEVIIDYELPQTSKIYIGSQQVKQVFVGNQPVKGVYVGTTKVLG